MVGVGGRGVCRALELPAACSQVLPTSPYPPSAKLETRAGTRGVLPEWLTFHDDVRLPELSCSGTFPSAVGARGVEFGKQSVGATASSSKNR